MTGYEKFKEYVAELREDVRLDREAALNRIVHEDIVDGLKSDGDKLIESALLYRMLGFPSIVEKTFDPESPLLGELVLDAFKTYLEDIIGRARDLRRQHNPSLTYNVVTTLEIAMASELYNKIYVKRNFYL